MKPEKIQGLMLLILLIVLVVIFSIILLFLSAASLNSVERDKLAAERIKRLNPISVLPSALILPPASNTPAILVVDPEKIDIEIDEMGLHIVTSPVLKVWRDRATGETKSIQLDVE